MWKFGQPYKCQPENRKYLLKCENFVNNGSTENFVQLVSDVSLTTKTVTSQTSELCFSLCVISFTWHDGLALVGKSSVFMFSEIMTPYSLREAFITALDIFGIFWPHQMTRLEKGDYW